MERREGIAVWCGGSCQIMEGYSDIERQTGVLLQKRYKVIQPERDVLLQSRCMVAQLEGRAGEGESGRLQDGDGGKVRTYSQGTRIKI